MNKKTGAVRASHNFHLSPYFQLKLILNISINLKYGDYVRFQRYTLDINLLFLNFNFSKLLHILVHFLPT